jgi:Lar family restriction alleviation protein
MSEMLLNACPFCGNADLLLDKMDLNIWSVLCNKCGCTGPILNYHAAGQTAAQAVSLWNKRGAK